jgi:chromosome segregation ATPase
MPTPKKPPKPSLTTVLERIDRLDARFGEMDSRFGQMQSSLDSRFGEMQGTMDSQFGEMGVRIDSQTLLLEDMRAQNRATIEAVETSRQALEQKIDTLTRDTRERIAVLDAAIKHLAKEGRSHDASLDLAIRDLKVSVQENSVDIRDLKAGLQQNSIDVRELAGKVEALTRLEERIAALERRLV